MATLKRTASVLCASVLIIGLAVAGLPGALAEVNPWDECAAPIFDPEEGCEQPMAECTASTKVCYGDFAVEIITHGNEAAPCIVLDEGDFVCIITGDGYGCEVGIAVGKQNPSGTSEHTNYAGLCSKAGGFGWCTGTFDTEEGDVGSCVGLHPAAPDGEISWCYNDDEPSFEGGCIQGAVGSNEPFPFAPI